MALRVYYQPNSKLQLTGRLAVQPSRFTEYSVLNPPNRLIIDTYPLRQTVVTDARERESLLVVRRVVDMSRLALQAKLCVLCGAGSNPKSLPPGPRSLLTRVTATVCLWFSVGHVPAWEEAEPRAKRV